MEHLHIILTSRLLPEIKEVPSEFTIEIISVSESLISKDILLYIAYRLETDRSLAKWPSDIRLSIQNILRHRRHRRGVFRGLSSRLIHTLSSVGLCANLIH
jgi:hypothetical protein